MHITASRTPNLQCVIGVSKPSPASRVAIIAPGFGWQLCYGSVFPSLVLVYLDSWLFYH